MATVLHSPKDEDEMNVFPLENGDLLSRNEFYRRWESMPELKIAERIEGVVYMQAAVRYQYHGHPHGHIMGWLSHYVADTLGLDFADNCTLQIDADNDPQPDACLFVLPEFGGKCSITSDGYLSGAPELIVEVAASSSSRDLNQKLVVYRRNGVQEYVVWKVMEREIIWMHLEGDEYVETPTDDNGLFKSCVFPGLWLDSAAMLAGDLKRVLTVQQSGVESREHATFASQLADRKKA